MLLNNIQLRQLLKDRPDLITGIGLGHELAESAAIQPASIDLTVGRIFVPPGTHEGGNDAREVDDFYYMDRGSAVLVVTQQKLNLDANIAGIMFPKNGDFALKAVLVTNFGHVDPGYDGYLKFTLINFGYEKFRIKVGEKIACLLLFHLEEDANPDWKKIKRHVNDNYRTHARVLNRDFLDIESRISGLVRNQVSTALNQRDRMTAVLVPTIAVVVAIVVTVGTIFFGFYTHFDTRLSAIQQSALDKIISLSKDVAQVESKVSILEKR